MEYLTTEWLIDWVNKNCESKEDVESKKNKALWEAYKVLDDKLKGVEITVEPIVFDAKDFSSSLSFSMALFIASASYKDTDDILVRYTKPKNDETKEVSIQFHILKSKAKMYQKFMRETNGTFDFAVETSGEIKSCIKYFNSLGTKGDGGEPLSSKEIDYAKDMKDALKKGENKIFVIISYDDELGLTLLEWNLVGTDYECAKFEDVKNRIDDIIKN